MAEIKWIKINVSMFDDEKIKIIETMPECDTILIIWLKLLTQAGKCNAGGFVMLTENIPYNEEMLASIFNRPLNSIRLALSTFKKLEMIEMNEEKIEITNWGKHQNLDAMDKVREQGKLRAQKHREEKKKKQEQLEIGTIEDEIPFKEIVSYLNEQANKNFKPSGVNTRKCIKARWREGFRTVDFKKAIDNKVASWKGTDMDKYLRPDTVFGTKFESYVNENPQTNAPRTTATQNEFDRFLEGE